MNFHTKVATFSTRENRKVAYYQKFCGSLFCRVLNQNVADASKNGVAQETIQNTIRRGSKVMTEQEARQILGVTEEAPWEEIVKVSPSFVFNYYLIVI